MAAACEGVPDLMFASADAAADPLVEAGRASVVDAGGTMNGTDETDAATQTDAASEAMAAVDSGSPRMGATGCPSNPPMGVTCCGTVACWGSASECSCMACAKCSGQEVCCPSYGHSTHCSDSFNHCY